MASPTLTTDNLFEAFLAEFPEFREEYEGKADLYWDDVGPITSAFMGWFLDGQILLPGLYDESGRLRDERFLQAMAFVERMLTEGDEHVQNMAETTVCEDIALEGHGTYERAKPYLGPKTLETCEGLRASMAYGAELDRRKGRWNWWWARRDDPDD